MQKPGREKSLESHSNTTSSTTDRLNRYRAWIDTLASAENRLYYRDQSSEALNMLFELVHRYRPTKIVELGTLSGLSLRTWLSATNETDIIAIDLSFNGLRQSLQILPADLSKVRFLEQDILKTDFTRLWSQQDRVLFYVDAHDEPGVPIMDHVLRNALPILPDGSILVIDDLWHSPTLLDSHNAFGFFEGTVLHQIDPLQTFDGYYAPYWKGGSFFGFREVIPLMDWVNSNRVELSFIEGIKIVFCTKPYGRR